MDSGRVLPQTGGTALQMPRDSQMSDELHRLQERLAHLLAMVEDMSDVIARQDREIDLLKSRVEMLMQREAERQAEQTGGIVLGNERPPHY